MKKHKKQNKTALDKATLVTVSALALLSAPLFISRASAAGNIACKGANKFDFGQHIACGTGAISITPGGGVNTVGCLINITAANAAFCTVKNQGKATTRSHTAVFTATQITLTGKGTETMKMDDFKMQVRGQTASATKMTFTSGEINGGFTLDIGGDVHFLNAQTAGSYSGSVQIRLDPI